MANHEDIIKEREAVVVDPIVEVEPVKGSEDKDPIVEPEPEPLAVDSVTGLLIGLDADKGLTDVLMVGDFNTETNEVKIVSVPRDLHIDFRQEPFKSYKAEINSREQDENGKNITKLWVSYCKVGELYYNLGKTDEAFYDVQAVVEQIIGLEIDYVAVIDVSGFADVVDAVGGVEFNVPQRMYYNDPIQDLYIDLEKGQQLLDGEHAMQLVRFRKYVLGDIQRISVQQDFVVAMYQQVMEKRNLDTILTLATSIYNIFDTDFGLTVVLDYAQYVFELDATELLNPENMVTIPSWGEKIEEVVNGKTRVKWFQYWDKDKAREVVEELMNK